MFDMGSPDGEAGRSGEESPLHRVWISRAFYMGKYEVTHEVWKKIMGTDPSWFMGVNRPVETVSWDNCQAFLAKLNAMQKESGQFRLPTEAEWEWACRAGTRTPFCFGDANAGLGEYAWYSANSGDMTYPVGRSKPNAWGLHDCHGNVLEWCSDWWGNYSANPWPGKFRWTRDPNGPAKGVSRVLRGGSWRDSPWHCRSACRSYASTTNRHERYGFRVALSIAGP
jgi:formylglycine-generating enzyme required for sulfatase activity